jgi:hypothetical protein
MAAPSEVEPWADGLDEVDPRELAMGRFRSRQETLAEIFSPEPISQSQGSGQRKMQVLMRRRGHLSGGVRSMVRSGN